MKPTSSRRRSLEPAVAEVGETGQPLRAVPSSRPDRSLRRELMHWRALQGCAPRLTPQNSRAQVAFRTCRRDARATLAPWPPVSPGALACDHATQLLGHRAERVGQRLEHRREASPIHVRRADRLCADEVLAAGGALHASGAVAAFSGCRRCVPAPRGSVASVTS